MGDWGQMQPPGDPLPHLDQAEVVDDGGAQRGGPLAHSVVAHPAVHAAPARVHPEAVLHPQVLCGAQGVGSGRACWGGGAPPSLTIAPHSRTPNLQPLPPSRTALLVPLTPDPQPPVLQ